MISKRIAVALATSVLALAPPSGASAQDVPVVFVHGIFSSSETWRGTSDRLASVVQITPHLVDMPSTATLDAQTAVLNAAQGSLPTNTIAVGHSQGGLISRQWSRSRPLKGVLTLGTPHGGSLLTKNALDLIRFNGIRNYSISAS